MTSVVDFYFDPVSPYSWLASAQLDRLAEAGVSIVCRPILLAALLNAHGTKGPAEVPAKRTYVFRDVMRQAAILGLEFRGPPAHPFNPLRALRAVLAIPEDEQRLRFVRELLAAIWSEGIDATDPEALRGILVRSGADGTSVLATLESAAVKQRLKDDTQEAIDAGVFGSPTFRFQGQLFWGADRLDALIWALQGGTIDEVLYADFLARPVGASRR